MPSRIPVIALLTVFAASAYALVSGAALLQAELPGGLPAGNALSALTLCALAGAAVVPAPPHTAARIFATVALLAAACWLPVSVALAGNLSLNFAGARGEAWMALTVLVAILSVAALAWSAFLRLQSTVRRAGGFKGKRSAPSS